MGQNLLLCKLSMVFGPISGGRERKSLRGAPPVEESQASDSIM